MTLAAKVARAARVPKGPTEYDIHVRVVAELHRRKAPGVRWWHTPNEGRRSARYASGLQLMGVSAGVPDLTIVRAGVQLPSRPCQRCRASGSVAGILGEYNHERCGECRGTGTIEPWRDGASAALELKRKGQKPTDKQTAWLEHFAAAGWLTGWADSVERALELLEGWGMLRP